MTSDFLPVISQNLLIVIVAGLILVLLGICAGYFIGNTSLRNDVTKKLDQSVKEGLVHKQVIDSVDLGVIVYGKDGIIYANETIGKFQGFAQTGIPADMMSFINCCDTDNQLKTNYMLTVQNGISKLRVNFYSNNKVYEIKILRKKSPDDEQLEIVIVEDITQVKDNEKRQKDLAANVSHELKTPMTVLMTADRFFDVNSPAEMPDYEKFKKWGDRMVMNCHRMQDIIDDFLILSETSMTNKMQIFDMHDCIKYAINFVEYYPRRDEVELIVVEPKYKVPLLFGNPRLVSRIITNLLTNAIKYNFYEGKTLPNVIKLSLSVLDDRVAVTVEDNGKGIPEKDVEHLFERFYRVDNSGSHDVGGTGIGLSIAKEIADMHEGAVSVNSRFGFGSTFAYTMPTAYSLFKMTRDDSKAGLLNEKPFYRAAAMFLGSQICEAVRSIGYDDMMDMVNDYESVPDIERKEKDKKLIELIKGFGGERYDDLMDELLFMDAEEEGLDDLVEDQPMDSDEVLGSNGAIIEPEYTTQGAEEMTTPEAGDAEQYMEEIPEPIETETDRDEKRRQKEEARKLLTQPILPRSPQYKAPEQPENENPVTKQPQDRVIHPMPAKKEYNTEARIPIFGKPKQPATEEGSKGVRSSLKKMLDESNPLKKPGNQGD